MYEASPVLYIFPTDSVIAALGTIVFIVCLQPISLPLIRQSQQKSSVFSSAEMFKNPLWQTVWNQIRLLQKEHSVLGPRCLLLYLTRQ